MRKIPTFDNDEDLAAWVMAHARSVLTQCETLETIVATFAAGASEEEREGAEDLLAHVQALTDAVHQQLRTATEIAA